MMIGEEVAIDSDSSDRDLSVLCSSPTYSIQLDDELHLSVIFGLLSVFGRSYGDLLSGCKFSIVGVFLLFFVEVHGKHNENLHYSL